MITKLNDRRLTRAVAGLLSPKATLARHVPRIIVMYSPQKRRSVKASGGSSDYRAAAQLAADGCRYRVPRCSAAGLGGDWARIELLVSPGREIVALAVRRPLHPPKAEPPVRVRGGQSASVQPEAASRGPDVRSTWKPFSAGGAHGSSECHVPNPAGVRSHR